MLSALETYISGFFNALGMLFGKLGETLSSAPYYTVVFTMLGAGICFALLGFLCKLVVRCKK